MEIKESKEGTLLLKIDVSSEKYASAYAIKILTEYSVGYTQEWRNKYNSIIVYDYEPFCADGFHHVITLDLAQQDKNKAAFAIYLINKYIETIQTLEKCIPTYESILAEQRLCQLKGRY